MTALAEPRAATIGDRLRSLRTRSGHTQESLAGVIHYAPSAVSNWENGHGIPSVTALVVLADSYGVSLDWIVTGRGSHEGRVLIGGRP